MIALSAVPLRWVAYGAAFLLAGLLLLSAYHEVRGQGESRARAELEPLIADLTVERDVAQAALALAEHDRRKAEDASRAYITEIESFSRLPVARGPVRVCVEPQQRPIRPLAATAAARSAGTATPAGSLSVDAGGNSVPGPDIGPDLRALAGEADRVSARLRALQTYCTDEAAP